MIDREHDLSIIKQAEVLKISRGSVYYLPRPVSSADLAIMRQLDRLHLEYPFAGSRMLRGLLALQVQGRPRHVKTLMRRMGIEALYRRPRTTKPEPGHKIHPYLLRGLEITRPNQVWAMTSPTFDGARLRLSRRGAGLGDTSCSVVAAVDHDGGGLLRRDVGGCSRRHGKPDIVNTDQGSQFTGAAFTGVLADNGIAISMDGKELGETTYSLRGCGRASNTRRSICEPTKQSARHEARLVGISTFTTGDDRIRVLTTAPGSSLLRSSSAPRGGLTPAEAPLIDAEILFRQPGPAQTGLQYVAGNGKTGSGRHFGPRLQLY